MRCVSLGSNFDCCTNLCIVPASLRSRSAPLGGADIFQASVLTLQICLPSLGSCTLIALKHLMVVSSMWPIRASC